MPAMWMQRATAHQRRQGDHFQGRGLLCNGLFEGFLGSNLLDQIRFKGSPRLIGKAKPIQGEKYSLKNEVFVFPGFGTESYPIRGITEKFILN